MSMIMNAMAKKVLKAASVGPMAPKIHAGCGHYLPDCAAAASWSIGTLFGNGVQTKDASGAQVRKAMPLPFLPCRSVVKNRGLAPTMCRPTIRSTPNILDHL